MRHERIAPIGRRFDAAGNLLITTPYRWDPALAGKTTAQLRVIANGNSRADWNSYQAQAARDELDRQAPKTASWCADAKKGWQPCMG